MLYINWNFTIEFKKMFILHLNIFNSLIIIILIIIAIIMFIQLILYSIIALFFLTKNDEKNFIHK